VVIGIIAVLISILLPTLSRARESANRVQCASNLRQYAQADMQYLNVSKDWHIPGYWDGPKSFYGKELNYNWAGITEFRRFIGMKNFDEFTEKYDGGPLAGKQVGVSFLPKKWFCPSSQFRGFDAEGVWGGQSYQAMYVYGMNVEGIDKGTSLDAANAGPWVAPVPPSTAIAWHAYRRGQVRRSSEKLMFVDAMSPLVNIWGSGQFPGWNGKVSNYDAFHERTSAGTLPDGRAYDATRTTAWRHGNGANVCFFDGHVEWLKKDAIYSYDSAANIIGNDRLWKVMQ
jgi:prepilin-type processing-associated H-X9-DG protein